MTRHIMELTDDKEYQRTTIGPRPSYGIFRSELAEFLTFQTPDNGYPKYYEWCPRSWTKVEIEEFVGRLEELFANSQRGLWPVIIPCIGTRTGKRRLLLGVFPKEQMEERNERVVEEYVSELLPDDEPYRVTVWKLSSVKKADVPRALDTINEILMERFAQGVNASPSEAVETDDPPPAEGSPIQRKVSVKMPEVFNEGTRMESYILRIERNQAARLACIDHYGPTCGVCGFDFYKTYGSRGKGFCHVHHLVPISSRRQVYEVDPIKDLIPVCPNCHAMLHTEDPPVSVEELREEVETRRDV